MPTLFVLELTVDSARGLPQVASSTDPKHPKSPSTFVAVEDVLVSGPKDKNSMKPPTLVPAKGWRCDQDLSDIIVATTKPTFNFSADLDFPRLSQEHLIINNCVPVLDSRGGSCANSTDGRSPSVGSDTSQMDAACASALKALKALTLSVWHHTDPYGDDDIPEGAAAAALDAQLVAAGEDAEGNVRPLTVSTSPVIDEATFWSKSTILGKVTIDLGPLRYYGDRKTVDGWYHIYDATDDVLQTSIGQIKCSVRYVPIMQAPQ